MQQYHQNKKKLVQNVFDQVYDRYDLMNDIMSFGIHRSWKKNLLNMINPSPNKNLIDVACGTGDIVKIYLDHTERKTKILNRFESICRSKNYKENFNTKLLEEVTNIVENPNVILASFDKKYLRIPKEIIISTLKVNQRYFPLFDPKNTQCVGFQTKLNYINLIHLLSVALLKC